MCLFVFLIVALKSEMILTHLMAMLQHWESCNPSAPLQTIQGRRRRPDEWKQTESIMEEDP